MSTTPHPTVPSDAPAVPPLNLVAQFKDVEAEVLAVLGEIARSGMYILGPRVAAFENALAQYCGVPHALGLSSGTDALLVALMALRIGPGDEVIVPTFTFFGTAGVVARVGARPIYCDIDPETYNIDVAQLERLVTSRTRAIIPVHLYGQCADMDAILALARRRDIPVVEDAAQAIGAKMPDGRPAGSMGTFGALSFYPTKNLGAMGDAGALLTRSAELFETARKLRVHGSGHTYYHDLVGGNFRIDVLQAAILHVKLAQLERWTEARRARAARYTALLADAGLTPEFVRAPVERCGRHVYHQYVIRAARRDALAEWLKDRRIGCGVYYPLPLHLQKCFAHLGYKAGDFPVAERAAEEVLALPIYPELTDAQQRAVVDAIAAFYRS